MEAANPDIKVTQKKVGTWNDAHDNLYTKLAAGSGLSDIEAIEVDWLPAMLAESDEFVDLTDPELDGRWLDWKAAAATNADGQLIGYGTDIGPEAICYRSDLFKTAGLPTDRDEVAALMGTTGTTTSPSASSSCRRSPARLVRLHRRHRPGHGQPGRERLRDPSDDTIDAENPEVKEIYATVDRQRRRRASRPSSPSGATTGPPSFQKDGFATMLCPGWMLGVIEGNAEGVKGWDIANVFPGGGGNWGGSFLTVPKQSEHPEEAEELAAWLTAPEQQVEGLRERRRLPEPGRGARRPGGRRTSTNEFFNNAPVGQILADRASRDHRAALQGTEVLRHPRGLPGRP